MTKISSILLSLMITFAQFPIFADEAIVEDAQVLSTFGENTITAKPKKAPKSISQAEIEKWQYVQNYFVDELKNDPRVLAKIGRFMNNHMPYFIAAEAPISLLASETVLNIASDLTNYIASNRITRNLLNKYRGSRVRRNLQIPTFLATMVILNIIAYHTTKVLANKLEGKESFYNTVLTNFVKNWNSHKDQTPATLQPLFNNLQKDYAYNNEKLSQDSVKNAQKIVDAVIETALIVEATK